MIIFRIKTNNAIMETPLSEVWSGYYAHAVNVPILRRTKTHFRVTLKPRILGIELLQWASCLSAYTPVPITRGTQLENALLPIWVSGKKWLKITERNKGKAYFSFFNQRAQAIKNQPYEEVIMWKLLIPEIILNVVQGAGAVKRIHAFVEFVFVGCLRLYDTGQSWWR